MLGDLTTLANAKSWLEIDSSITTDDNNLTRLITSASQFIQSWLNRTIPVTSYNEFRNGNNQYSMATRAWPIQSITGLTIDGAVVPAAPPMQSNNPISVGYVFDQQTIYLRGFQFYWGVQNIQIQYSAGYTSTPADIEQACIELVSWAYHDRGREGEASKNIGNGQVVAYKITDMSPRTLTALQAFKNSVPIWS